MASSSAYIDHHGPGDASDVLARKLLVDMNDCSSHDLTAVPYKIHASVDSQDSHSEDHD